MSILFQYIFFLLIFTLGVVVGVLIRDGIAWSAVDRPAPANLCHDEEEGI